MACTAVLPPPHASSQHRSSTTSSGGTCGVFTEGQQFCAVMLRYWSNQALRALSSTCRAFPKSGGSDRDLELPHHWQKEKETSFSPWHVGHSTRARGTVPGRGPYAAPRGGRKAWKPASFSEEVTRRTGRRTNDAGPKWTQTKRDRIGNGLEWETWRTE